VTPTELLAELHRRGIAVRATRDGHLRLTGASEAALTPALRRDVEAQRSDLVALLAREGSGPTDAGTAMRPLPQDTAAPAPPPVDRLPGSERTAPPAEGSSEVPGWLAWGGIAALTAAVLGVVYLIGRPSAAPQPEAPPPPGAAYRPPWAGFVPLE
jgi:hypothetical protein